MEIFQVWPLGLLLAAGLLGLVVGSFLNVVAFRVPIMMETAWRRQLKELQEDDFKLVPHVGGERFNLWRPGSACTHCGHRIAPRHNIPLLSYLILRGRCAHCGARISVRYPLVEALAALASLCVAWVFGPSWQTLAALGFTWTLVALTLIDIDHKLLPDSLTLPLMWAGLLLSLVSIDGMPIFSSVRDSVIGAAAGYLALWFVYQAFKLATGKEGMGYGDFKLLAAIGAWLGWQSLPLVILLSAATGSVFGIAMIAFGGRSRHATLPFGPYLAAAAWIAMLWGDRLQSLYLATMP